TLAVVVGDGREIEAERGVALQGDGGVVRQQIDLTRLQRREALLRGQWHVFDLLRLAEDRGRDGTADIDVQADPLALAVGHGEARDAGRHAADYGAARLDGVEVFARQGGARSEHDGEACRQR